MYLGIEGFCCLVSVFFKFGNLSSSDTTQAAIENSARPVPHVIARNGVVGH